MNMQIKYKYTYLQQITTNMQHALNLNLATTCNIKIPCNIHLRKTNMQKKYHTLTNMHSNKSYESKYKIDRLRNVNKVNRDFNENIL